MNSEKFKLPSHWATALVNDDESSFYHYGDTKDLAAYRQFTQEHLHLGYFTVVKEDESYFATVHDATEYGVLPCDVVDLLFVPYF
jgi:L-ascorbate metabolism protein UlaG (beta-lactamase superfamily)